MEHSGMTDMHVLTKDELVEIVKAKLRSRPYESTYHTYKVAPDPTEPAAYTLILGAGFSQGVIPLVGELMKETIGDYYYPDQDQWGQRPASVNRKDSARFWKKFNNAAAAAGLPIVEVNDRGLPKDAGATYQYLFTYECANVLFKLDEQKLEEEKRKRKPSLLERLQQQREGQAAKPQKEGPNTGEVFVKGFLRYVLDPHAAAGYGSTGRSELNRAHIYLAALLEAQQLGQGWETVAFCRTIFTTNFDTLLQNALQSVRLLYTITDRPEKGIDSSDWPEEEGPIHLVYVHGSILRHNPASTIGELGGLASRNIEVLRAYLEARDVIVIGYGGWNDGLMAALRQCDSKRHTLYWCDVRPQPASHVASFLSERADSAAYVHLSEGGADDFMRALYEALIPAELRRDPMARKTSTS